MLPGVFDVVIAPPPNRATGTSLVPMVADVVVNNGIAIRAHTLQKVGQVPVVKSLNTEDRPLALGGKYVCGSDLRQLQVKRALIIDDVLDSGSTITEACRALKQAFPDAALYAIAMTYLRPPNEGRP